MQAYSAVSQVGSVNIPEALALSIKIFRPKNTKFDWDDRN
jgi:hypothetical protein